MGDFTWELRAGSAERIITELSDPRLSAADLCASFGHDPDVDDALTRWSEVSTAVASTIAAGGGELRGPEATYVFLVVRHLSHFYGALVHSTADDDDFRHRFLPGPAAKVLGGDLVGDLLLRDLAGVSVLERPMIGWVELEHLQEASARGLDVPELGDPCSEAEDDEDRVWTLVDVVERAAVTGQDLMGVYG